MYAVIVGAGEVGFHIATILSQEGHEVAVIDRDRATYEKAAEELDVLAIHGNGASPRVLEQASMGRADLVVAVTNSDEVNMIACLVAKQMGVPRTVARVRNQDYVEDGHVLSSGLPGVDYVIQPEMAVADEVIRIASIPGALDVEVFARGQVCVVEVQVGAESAATLVPLRDLDLPVGVLVSGVMRAGETIVPRGDFLLRPGDRVFLLGEVGAPEAAAERLTGQHGVPRKAILLGCGEIGIRVALGLEERHIGLTVFEKDPNQAARAADLLRRSMVIADEGIDERILVQEGVPGADIFIAATGDDRLNILTALMAKQLGARRVVAIVERGEFSRVVESIGVDVAISPRRMTASAILRFVRAGTVLNAAVLDKSAAEVLEFLVEESSSISGRSLAEVDFPRGAIVGAVVRGEKVNVPDGRTVLQGGDVAIVFAATDVVHDVERLFASRRRR